MLRSSSVGVAVLYCLNFFLSLSVQPDFFADGCGVGYEEEERMRQYYIRKRGERGEERGERRERHSHTYTITKTSTNTHTHTHTHTHLFHGDKRHLNVVQMFGHLIAAH
jgi:hypothetical protein